MQENGLVQAYILDGSGGGSRVGWQQVEGWQAGQGTVLWLHLDYSHPFVRQWLKRREGLDRLVLGIFFLQLLYLRKNKWI